MVIVHLGRVCIKRGSSQPILTGSRWTRGGVGSIQLHWPVLMLLLLQMFYSRTEGGLHDDARCTAFGDLLHRFPIVGILDGIQDLRAGNKEHKSEPVTALISSPQPAI